MIKILFKGIKNRKKIFKNNKNGFCLVHGDTVSTFLGALLGKLAKQKVVHIESGLRTKSLFKPFPEEMVRRIVDKMSYLNFAFDEASYEALDKMNLKGKFFNLEENTLIDAVNWAKTQKSSVPLPQKFILVSIHRYETIHSQKRMEFIVNTLLKLAKNNKIVWGVHPPTKNALIKYNLLEKVEKNENITLRGLFDYFDFINAISKSDYLITDGGGPQDETRYLNIPCLIMRTENERPTQTHIHEAKFDHKEVEYFINNYNKFRAHNNQISSPSKRIVEIIINDEKNLSKS